MRTLCEPPAAAFWRFPLYGIVVSLALGSQLSAEQKFCQQQCAREGLAAEVNDAEVDQQDAKTGRQDRSAESDDLDPDGVFDTVVGTVVTPDGHPVAGIDVLAFKSQKLLEQKFRTDEKGQFQVPKAWRFPNHYLTLIVRDQNRQLGWFEFFFHAHSENGQQTEDGSFQIVLLPLNRTVRGQLLDTQGHPLAGVSVRYQYLQHEINFASAQWHYHELNDAPLVESVLTDQEGRYELKLPADTFAWLGCNHPDWIGKRIRVAKDAIDAGATTLVRGAKVTGRVIDSRTGRPLSTVSIAAQATHPKTESGWGVARTDADGRFVIGGLSEGEFRIFVENSSFKRLTAAALTLQLEPGRESKADFALIVGERISGTVVDAKANQPVPDCTVHYSGPARPGPAVLAATTDQDGHFEFYVPPGACRVYIGEFRAPVDGQSVELNVAADHEPDAVVLKAGAKPERDQGNVRIKICVGPVLDRKVSLDLEGASLSEALQAACQAAGIRAELEEGIECVPFPVTIKRQRVPLRDALREIMQPFKGYAYGTDNDQIFAGSRRRVMLREKAILEGKVPPPFDESTDDFANSTVDLRLRKVYRKGLNDITLVDALVEFARDFRMVLDIHRNEIQAAKLESNLSYKLSFQKEHLSGLYALFTNEPERAPSWAKTVIKREDGTIRGYELLSFLLEPCGLDYYTVDNVLHLTTAEVAGQRRNQR